MKKIIFLHSYVIYIQATYICLICILVFSSCKTADTAFIAPDDVKNIRATVYLKDNTLIEGYMTLTTANKKNLSVRVPKQRKTISVPLAKVEGYDMEDNYYAYKLLHPSSRGSLIAEKKSFYGFVKRLTPEHYFLQIYEYVQKVKEEKSSLTRNIVRYYVALPNGNTDELWDLEGEQFYPDFATKMGALLSECPELVQKIQDKEVGYYPRKIGFKSTSKLKVLINIANYYQQFVQKSEQASSN